MEKIHSILNTFSKSEIKYLKNLLNVFHGKGDNKLLELVQLIEKNPNITQDEASLKLYRDAKSKAFFMTKGRLMERLYDMVLLTTDLPNASLVEEDPYASRLADLYKKLALVIALRKRGLTDIAVNVIEVCLKDEMLNYSPNLKIAYLENYRAMVVDDIEKLHDMNNDLSNTLNILYFEIMSSGFIQEVKFLTRIKNYNKDIIKDFLISKIKIMEDTLSNVYSPKIHLISLYLKELLFDLQRMTLESKKILEEWIDLLKKHPLIADNNRNSLPYIKLAHIELYEKNFDNSIKLALEIAPSIKHRIHNYIVIKSVEFFSSFYIGKFDEIISFDTSVYSIDSPNFYYIEYIKFCASYAQKKYKIINLDVLTPFLDNKNAHNARIRIFEILIYIETEKIDLAVAKIEALRKHISKYDAIPRVLATYKILHYIESLSFDFSRKNEKVEQMLIDLEENTPWSPFSLEAIRFDTWVRAQYNHCSYWEQWKSENPQIFSVSS